MSAASASLKNGYTSLKIRNLSPFYSDFKQTDFLRFVSPIFLTLTSQGGNQGMLTSYRELKVRFQRWSKKEIRLREIQFLSLQNKSPPSFPDSLFLTHNLYQTVIYHITNNKNGSPKRAEVHE
jgi:hypothetical protein